MKQIPVYFAPGFSCFPVDRTRHASDTVRSFSRPVGLFCSRVVLHADLLRRGTFVLLDSSCSCFVLSSRLKQPNNPLANFDASLRWFNFSTLTRRAGRDNWFFACLCERCVAGQWDAELTGLRCPVASCSGAVPPPWSSGELLPLASTNPSISDAKSL